ncbi:MAG: TIGR03905 family TSCPD domain-containing protein [Treponema sp.]|jgi:uncharacterized protein (TIGR03905 family)|nr:TIGR03905 family TSCPD domain-containing protein [Treponema sp.]
MFEYKTKGTCSTKISFDLKDGVVHEVVFTNGCNGNLKALSRLVEGMRVEELVSRLKGIECGGRKTSCADQLAGAVEQAAGGVNPR